MTFIMDEFSGGPWTKAVQGPKKVKIYFCPKRWQKAKETGDCAGLTGQEMTNVCFTQASSLGYNITGFQP